MIQVLSYGHFLFEIYCKMAPVMFGIFEAPYGMDLCWLYEEGVHIGFYDVVADKEVTIDAVIKQN
ncbi:hypothetical protein [Bacillus sp. C1]